MELVQVILASLQDDADVDDAWTIEVERRIANIESGVEKTIPMAEALAQVRKNLTS